MQLPDKDENSKTRKAGRTIRHLRYEPGEVEADAHTILKKLFDRIVQECGVHHGRWKKLCDAYIHRQEVERGEPIANPVEARASINKNFGSMPTMTFKNFFKGLIFMRIVRAKITIQLEHNSGAITEHGVIWTADKASTFDPETDYEPRPPTTVESAPVSAYATAVPADDYRVAPPDVSKFAGEYPEITPAAVPGDDNSGSGSQPTRPEGVL